MKKQPKIIKLDIEDGFLNGVDAIAFVEEPAIEIDFQYFSKQLEQFESFNDYPEGVVSAAKRGIELNEENGMKCATQVGKVRAQQLANRENVSLDTIKRMRSFLLRQKDNYDLATKRKDYNACGYISYLLWGGEDAIAWTEKKLRQSGIEFDLALEIPDYNNETDDEDINNFIFEKIIEDKMEKLARVGLSPDNQPYYKTPEEARLQSPKYGCSMDSWHEYKLDGKTYFMPCGSHDQLFAKEESWIDELTDDIEMAVESALMSVGKDEQQLIDEGYDMSSAVVLNAKDEFVASTSKIRNASRIDQPSVDDFGTKQVLYRYMNYNGTESTNSNSRQFCRNVIAANKWFRKEDINKLTITGANEGFGLNGQTFYDIFNYKGGKNCKHFWQAIQFNRDIPATTAKKPQAVLDRIVDATTLNPGSLTNILAESRLGFSKEEMDEQQIVATPIMVPNKLIPRRDEFGEIYYVYFSEDTIKKIAYAFAQSKSTDSINLEHDMDSMVDDVYLAESWLINEPQNDKSNVFGYNLEKGSWFGLFKVNNDEFWNDYIKTGKVKGVSVEGYFVNKLTKLQ
tara:strand:+ start:1407 stop:3113 length:1707 start_codon:yes stop_codon:yes gene_type:complete